MRHRNAVNKLSRPSGHRRALMRNLANALITRGSIRTTQAKAKALRPHVEQLITLARRGDQHAQRIVFSRLQDKAAVKELFTNIGPQQRSRHGGYTRITKIGRRAPCGDAAPMALIEIIGPAPGEAPKEKPKRRRRTKKGEAAAE
jgi:large subunit ribosomal protein L17